MKIPWFVLEDRVDAEEKSVAALLLHSHLSLDNSRFGVAHISLGQRIERRSEPNTPRYEAFQKGKGRTMTNGDVRCRRK